MALIQTWGCILLAVLCVIFSFTPLFTLKTIDNAAEIEKTINESLKSTGTDVEIPEEIDISSIKLVKSISLIIDVVKVTKEIADAAKQELMGDASDFEGANLGGTGFKGEEVTTKTEQEKIDLEEKIKELQDLLASEESRDTLITAFAIVTTVSSVIGTDAENGDSGIGTIITMALTAIALFYVLGLTLLFPFIFAICTLITLIRVLANIKNPLNSAPIAAKLLNGLILLPLLSILFQCVIPGIDFGTGTVAILVIACISTIINIVISRTRDFPADKNLFSLIVQGGALVGSIGFAVYFFNIIKTNILSTFLHGDWGAYAASASSMKKTLAFIGATTNISWAFVIDGLLIAVYAGTILGSIGYFVGCVNRLTLNGTGTKYSTNAPAHFIPMTAFLTIGAALPLVVAKMENLYENFIDKTDGTYPSLILKDDSKSALTIALVGLCIMLVAEIAIAIFSKKFCNSLSQDDKQEVLKGKTTLDAEEAPATPAKKVATAPAKQAAETKTNV